jgi:hypothetical protein
LKTSVGAFLLAILVVGLLFANGAQFSTVQASTDVSGAINTDTTWTLTNSPYVFVAPGVTLTVNPGVNHRL